MSMNLAFLWKSEYFVHRENPKASFFSGLPSIPACNVKYQFLFSFFQIFQPVNFHRISTLFSTIYQ